MEAPNQNKIVGRELAVARAHYGPFEDGGKQKSGYIFKEQMIADPVMLELHGITMEAMLDCVGQLEDMGSYDEVAKEQGYDKGGYKPTGLVITSKADSRLKCSVEFGHRWNKDSDAQNMVIPGHEKLVTLKWFVDVDNQDREMGAGAVPEREVTPEEMDLISKIREQTKEVKMKSESRIYQPVLEAVKSHKDYLKPKPNKKPLVESGYEDAGQEEPMDYERDVVGPSWEKWTARGGKPKYLGNVILKDEGGDEAGRIQVYQARHADHGNLPGIHLNDPDQHAIDDAIENASNQGFGEIIIHGDIPPGLKLEGKEIKGAIMREKRTFGMDCESVDFFGLPKLQEDKPAKKLGEAESTYAPTYKPAKAPLVSKDPQTKDKEVDKLDGSGKMKDKDGKPLPMQAGSAIEKPHSEVGKEYDQKPHDQSKIKVGDPGDDHGDHVEGSGKSDMQQTALPAGKMKVGKPGDDSGKHMEDGKKVDGTPLKEAAMLRRPMPERGAKSQSKELSDMQDVNKKKAMLKQNAYEARKKMGHRA